MIYPTENAVLAAAIADQGLRVSEKPMGLQPQARHFPPRNRIISGLSLAVVVVEAAEKSGTLITTRDALDQGREIMAVPGHPVDGRAGGCNRLIREGATLVRHVDDVLEVLRRLQDTGSDVSERTTPPPPMAQSDHEPPLHTRILALLGPSPIAEDQLIRDLSLSAATISPTLVMLEMQGSVRRHPGGLVSRA